MICKNCNESMEGDGYTAVWHCPYLDEVAWYGREPDAEPVYCPKDLLVRMRYALYQRLQNKAAERSLGRKTEYGEIQALVINAVSEYLSNE